MLALPVTFAYRINPKIILPREESRLQARFDARSEECFEGRLETHREFRSGADS